MSESNQQQEKRLLLMKEEKVQKALISMAVPSVIAMLVNALYNFIDTMFVGMLNNTDAMAGVSIGFPVFLIILALGQLVGIGASSYAGRMLGAGKKESAQRTAGIAVSLGVFFAILSVSLGLIFIETILGFMGATENVMGYAKDYCTFLILGSLFTINNMVFNNLLRTEGAAKMSMTTLILGAVVNVILDPIFMFDWGLGFGVAGAAMATVIAQCCSTIYILSYYIRGKSIIKINKNSILTKTPEDKEIVISIIKIGSPMFLMQVLTSAAFGLLNSAAATFGPAALATLGISNKIYSMFLQVLQGYVQAFLPFTAFNVGANQYNRVKQGVVFSLKLAVTLGISATILFNITPEIFIKMFTKDTEVIKLGVNCLRAQTYMLGAVAAILIMNALFQAMGKSKEAAVLAIGRQGLFFIPMILILPKVFENGNPIFLESLVSYPMKSGLYGVMFAQPVADITTFVLAAGLGVKTYKYLDRLEKEQNTKVQMVGCVASTVSEEL
ncbi:MAG: MATE family efflux transporter [Peptostreptococcaceae bacterium]